jgi:hypothetical protein
MRFTVVWDALQVDRLADLWTSAKDQQAVADAADEIDKILRESPKAAGALLGVLRTLRVVPLEVAYLVSEVDCLVTVMAVRRVP